MKLLEVSREVTCILMEMIGTGQVQPLGSAKLSALKVKLMQERHRTFSDVGLKHEMLLQRSLR